MITTRLIMPRDLNDVLSLAEMQVEETLPHLDFRRDLAEDTFWRSVTKGHPTGFVAEQDGEVIGYLMARLDEYSFASGVFVSQEVIYVRPDKRGTRAAVHLIKEFMRWGEIVGAQEWLFGVSNGFQPDRTARLFEKVTGAERVGYHLRKTR